LQEWGKIQVLVLAYVVLKPGKVGKEPSDVTWTDVRAPRRLRAPS